MNLKSDKLNTQNVMLAFYRPVTRIQKFKAKFGIPVVSMSLIIDNKLYQFRWGEKYMQERTYTNEYLKKYYLLDTGFKSKELIGNWKNLLLKQKARQWDRLFIRLRCVKSLSPVLNQLPKKWHYRFGDLLSSFYLWRRRNG